MIYAVLHSTVCVCVSWVGVCQFVSEHLSLLVLRVDMGYDLTGS